MTKDKSGMFALDQVAKAAQTLIGGAAQVFGYRSDSWENPLTGLGTSRDKAQYAQVKAVVPLTVPDLENLFNGDDLARRVVTALPEAALRQGVRLQHPGGDTPPETQAEQIKALTKALKKFSVIASLNRASTWGRLYGRGAILLGVDGAGAMSSPYDPAKRPGKLKWISVLDRRDFSVSETDPDTGAPVLWRLETNTTTVTLVHDSRFIFFGGAMTSDRDRLRMQWSDFSVLQTVIEAIRDVNTVWGSTAHLVTDASQAVYKVKGLFDMITQGNVDSLLLRFGLIDQSRSTVRGIVVDAEDEDYTRTSTSFAGLPEVNQTSFQRLAAAARMPVTVLMGMSPAGLNATGESDTRSWYAEVEAYQTHGLQDPTDLLINLIAVSEGLPSGWVAAWPSLWTMNPQEEATHTKTVVETDAIEISGGIVLSEEVAAHRHSGAPDAWFTPVPIDLEVRRRVLATELAKLGAGAPSGAATDTTTAAGDSTVDNGSGVQSSGNLDTSTAGA